MIIDAHKPWKELTRAERRVRLGDPTRWEQPRAAEEAWEDEVIRRYNNHLYLSKHDRMAAKRIIKRRAQEG